MKADALLSVLEEDDEVCYLARKLIDRAHGLASVTGDDGPVVLQAVRRLVTEVARREVDLDDQVATNQVRKAKLPSAARRPR